MGGRAADRPEGARAVQGNRPEEFDPCPRSHCAGEANREPNHGALHEGAPRGPTRWQAGRTGLGNGVPAHHSEEGSDGRGAAHAVGPQSDGDR